MRRPSSAVSRPARLAALVSLALAGTAAHAVSPLRANAPGLTDQIIIKYRDESMADKMVAASAESAPSLGLAQAAAARHGVAMAVARHTATRAVVTKLDRRLPVQDVARIAAEIAESDPSVLYAEPDRMMKPAAAPNDPMYASQWHYKSAGGGINAESAWGLSTGAGVVVAVLDTGYRRHVDLAANLLNGYDFIHDPWVARDGGGRDSGALDPGDWTTANECDDGEEAADSSWHGTHVAGTIAAVSNNGVGVAGVAYNAKILPVRVLGRCGGYNSDIADAIIWASGGSVAGVPANANPARVINLSLGGPGACDSTTQAAVNSARSRNSVVVVAAGNSADNAANYSPASCAGVITVGSVGRLGARAGYSNFGSKLAVAAPGGDMSTGAANGVLSTLNAGAQGPGADAYAYYQGTSMAAPHVAGVVALMLSRNPALTPTQVQARLRANAKFFPSGESDLGAGIVDAYWSALSATATNVSERESNDSRATAQLITATNASVSGSMASTSDVDYYRVALPAGKQLRASMAPVSTDRDFELAVLNSAGTVVGSSENGAGLTERVLFTNNATGTVSVYVRVSYFGGGAGSYNLSLKW